MARPCTARLSRLVTIMIMVFGVLAGVATPAGAVIVSPPAASSASQATVANAPQVDKVASHMRQLAQPGRFRKARAGRILPEPARPSFARKTGVVTTRLERVRKVRKVHGKRVVSVKTESVGLKPNDVEPPSAGSFTPTPLKQLVGNQSIGASPIGQSPPTTSYTLTVEGGLTGVPSSGVTAVALSVTASDSTPSTFGSITAYPTGLSQLPPTSDMEYSGGGQTTSSTVFVAPSSSGQVTLVNQTSFNNSVLVSVNVEGYFTANGTSQGFIPTMGDRVADTTTGLDEPGGIPAQLRANSTLTVTVAGGATVVPTTAQSVAVNIEAIQPVGAGSLVAYPTGGSTPSGAEVSTVAGQNGDDLVQVQVGTGGQITVSTTVATDLRVDIEGYTVANAINPNSGAYVALSGPQTAYPLTNTNSGTTITQKVVNQSSGATDVPAGASSVLAILGEQSATAGGKIRAWATGTPAPSSTQMDFNYGGGDTDTVIVPIGNEGQINVRPDITGGSGTAMLTIRIEGYYTGQAPLFNAANDPTPYLGNEHYWSYSPQIPVGPQANADVNVSDGNLVVSATDSTPIPGHGHLDYVIRRTYNSLDNPGGSGVPAVLQTLTGGFLSGTIGDGWTLNLGGFGTGLSSAGLSVLDDGGLTSLITPAWIADTPQSVNLPAGDLVLVDQDGTRHLFTASTNFPTTASSALASNYLTGTAHGLGTLSQDMQSLFTTGTSSLGELLQTSTGLSGNFCISQSYSPPPGVNMNLWSITYLPSPQGNTCAPGHGTSAVTVAYVAERPDGLRFVYSTTGQLLDEIDRAGTDLRFGYGNGALTTAINATNINNLGHTLTALPLVGPVVNGSTTIGTQLQRVWEAGVPGCSTATGDFNTSATDCRSIQLTYSDSSPSSCPNNTYGYAVCITDPAGRTTDYYLSSDPAGLLGHPGQLVKVVNPDTATGTGSSVSYQYGCNGGNTNQLCSITDENGNTTNIYYDGASGDYPDSVQGPLVSKITDRRNIPTTFQYTLGKLGATQVAAGLFSPTSGLSSTTEVVTPVVGTTACNVNSTSSAGCRVSQYTGIDSGGRVAEYDRGTVSGSATCTDQPSGPNDGGGICAQQVSLTNWDVGQLATPSTPTAVPGHISGGALASNTYNYEIAAVDGSGTTAASTQSLGVVVGGSNNSVTLSWPAETGATAYDIYGRQGGGDLIAEVPATSDIATQSWIDDGTQAANGPAAPTTNGTYFLTCELSDGFADNNACSTTTYGDNDASTGQLNDIFTPNRFTVDEYGPDGSLVRQTISLGTGLGSLVTTYGYAYQYWTADGNVTNTATSPTGSGSYSTPTSPPSNLLYLIADRTSMLTPNGNAVSRNYSHYETTYHPDDNDLNGSTPVPPNQLPSGDPATATVCKTGANAGAPTSNTGLNCETDAPAPTGAAAENGCQAASGQTCATYTYDGWGEKLSMTTPLAHTLAVGAQPAYRYAYYADSQDDMSGTTPAGGWLQAVVDPLATHPQVLTDASSASQVQAETSHYVVFGQDAAGDTMWTWDRDAVAANGVPLSSYTSTVNKSAQTISANEPGYAQTLYGSSAEPASSTNVYTLAAHPWRYTVSSSTPMADQGGSSPPAETTTTVVDANGNPTSITPPNGNTSSHPYATVNVYDADDEQTSTTTPLGYTTSTGYDDDNNPYKSTDPNGNVSYTLYDSLDLPAATYTPQWSSAYPGSANSSYASGYAPAGCSTSQSSAALTVYGLGTLNGFYCEAQTLYDGFGDPAVTLDANGHAAYTFYDADGRKIGQSVSYGAPTTQPTQSTLGNTFRPPNVAYLNTIWLLDSDGNTVETCTPGDFDYSGGALAGNSLPGPGNSLPGAAAVLTALESECGSASGPAAVPLYGNKSDYDAADQLTTSISYRAAAGTTDPTWSTNSAFSDTGVSPASTTVTTLITRHTYDADGNPETTLDPAADNQTVNGSGAVTASPVAPNATQIPTTDTYNLLDEKVCESVPRGANGAPADGLPAIPAACANTPTTAPDVVSGQVMVVNSTWGYDDSGDVTSVSKPSGDDASSAVCPVTSDHLDARVTDYSYDLDHRVTTMTQDVDPNNSHSNASCQDNLQTSYTYDLDGNVIQQFDPRAYDAATSGASMADYSTVLTYDADDQPTASYTPHADSAITSSPVPSGQCTASVPSQSSQNLPASTPAYVAFPSTASVCETQYGYDHNGNQTSVTLPSQTSSDSPTITTQYTQDNLVAAVTPPDPQTGSGALPSTTYTYYDGDSQPVQVIDPDHKTTLTTYSGNNLPIDVRDAAGTAALQIHDTLYDANGDQNAAADYVSAVAWGSGRNGAWQVTATAHNSDGTTASSADESTDMPDQDLTGYRYDPDGNTTTITSPVATNNRSGPTTTDSYTADGLLYQSVQSVTSSETRTTAYIYDAAGRKMSQSVSDSSKGNGGTQSYTYYPNDLTDTQTGRAQASGDTDPSGNPDTLSNGTSNGAIVATDSYDSAGNLTSVADNATYPAAAGSYGSSITATYTLDSLLANVTEGSQAETNTYDGAGDLTQRTVATGGTSHSISFTNGDSGLPTSAATDQADPGNGGKTWTFNYDPTGLLTNATYPDGETLTNTYYATGQTYPSSINGYAETSAARNDDEELATSVLTTSGGTPVVTDDYTGNVAGHQDIGYDGLGRILSQNINGTTESFTYDPAGRVCAYNNGTSTSNIDYDADGNRTGYGTTVLPELNCGTNGNQNTSSQYTYNLDDSLKNNNGQTVSYDAAGRMTSDGTNIYCYDGFDQTEIVTPKANSCSTPGGTSTTQYSYDGLSRQTSSQLNGGTPETFGYDALGSDVVSDSDSLGGTSTNAIDYLRNSDGSPLAVGYLTNNSGDLTQYLTDDGKGDIGAVTTGGGSSPCVLRYDPYGTSTANSNCSTYAGRLYYNADQRDSTTGNYQNGSRTYNPSLDAFTTPDTYGPGTSEQSESVGTDPLTADTYTYVNGDPVNYDDPDGHVEEAPADTGMSASGAHQVSTSQLRNQVLAGLSGSTGLSTGYCVNGGVAVSGVGGTGEICIVDVHGNYALTIAGGPQGSLSSLTSKALAKRFLKGLFELGLNRVTEMTNAPTLEALGGKFAFGSFSAGIDFGGIVGGFKGTYKGSPVVGGFYGAGIDDGLSIAGGYTETSIAPLPKFYGAALYFEAKNPGQLPTPENDPRLYGDLLSPLFGLLAPPPPKIEAPGPLPNTVVGPGAPGSTSGGGTSGSSASASQA